MATDGLILVLTWIKTADVWREGSKSKTFKGTISTLLLRDGTVYFGALVIMNIVIIGTALWNDDNQTAFVSMFNAVGANLLARFILDLRCMNDTGSNKLRTISSIKFVGGSLGGNMGAALEVEDSMWVTGPADDIANGRDQQYEEVAVPFSAGLGLEIEEVPRDVIPTEREALGSDLVGSSHGDFSTDLQGVSRNVFTAASNV
ncbi:hypothetical protein EIP91_004122 [Steccherinum ochraceum]|uniref:Uncharacterized protein n=1 Tax=Steccherinum ochraceum TaxID=92696 RepID=A0A4R0RBV1_9APHY|nr:hypothetical protein EIP91_004122 [Steccherinum ochraceum]